MREKLKKVLFITNIPAPYRIDFYNELGKYCDLTVLFEAKRAPSIKFNWKEDCISTFTAIFLKEGEIKEKRIDWSIFKYIKKIEHDYIFITNYSYYTEMAALCSFKLRNIPYYYEIDGAMVKPNEGVFKRAFKSFFLRGATTYFSPSSFSDDYIIHYTASKKIHRYPFSSVKAEDILTQPTSSFEKLELRNKLGIKEDNVVLAIGQFIPRKGFDILIKAARKLDQNTGIYIVGGHPTLEYINLKNKYNLKHLYFEGFKSKEELSEYFMAADIFVHPTREDIWGLVINEAMAFGLPIVTTNKCVAGLELLDNKQCIIDSENVEDLSISIKMILNDNALQRKLSIENLDKIKQYTIERMVNAHLSYIK